MAYGIKKNFVGVGKFLLVPKTTCGLNDILFLRLKHAKKPQTFTILCSCQNKGTDNLMFMPKTAKTHLEHGCI